MRICAQNRLQDFDLSQERQEIANTMEEKRFDYEWGSVSCASRPRWD